MQIVEIDLLSSQLTLKSFIGITSNDLGTQRIGGINVALFLNPLVQIGPNIPDGLSSKPPKYEVSTVIRQRSRVEMPRPK